MTVKQFLFWCYALIAFSSMVLFFVGLFWTESWKMTIVALAINVAVSQQLQGLRYRP